MPWGAAIAGAAALGSAAISASASGGAAGQQAAAGQAAADQLFSAENVASNNLGPYLNSGLIANSDLMGLVGLGGTQANPTFNPNAQLVAPFTQAQFQASPGYQYQLGQTNNAILNNASALGGPLGGNTLMALQQNASGLANQDWYNAQNQYYNQQNNVFNKLNSIAGAGQNAGNALVNTRLGAATQGANIQTQIGNAQAAGTVGQANAVTGGLNNLSQLAYLFSGGGSSGGNSFLFGGNASSGGLLSGGGGLSPTYLGSDPYAGMTGLY